MEEDDDVDFEVPRGSLKAFTLFSQEFRPVLKQRYPNLTTQQIKQAVGKQWSLLSHDQHALFEEMSKNDKPRQSESEYNTRHRAQATRTMSSLSLQQQNAANSALSIMDSTAVFINKLLRNFETLSRRYDDEIEPSINQQHDDWNVGLKHSQSVADRPNFENERSHPKISMNDQNMFAPQMSFNTSAMSNPF